MKFKTKTDDIITWLSVNDVGSLSVVLEGIISQGQVEGQTEKDYENYWASIRSLCGTLPNSPIRRGIQSSLTAEQSANVDSVIARIESAFASIGEADLILDVMHPRQRGDSIGHYDSIEAWASNMAQSVERQLKLAIKENRWTGELTDGLTNMALKEPKAENTEVSSEE